MANVATGPSAAGRLFFFWAQDMARCRQYSDSRWQGHDRRQNHRWGTRAYGPSRSPRSPADGRFLHLLAPDGSTRIVFCDTSMGLGARWDIEPRSSMRSGSALRLIFRRSRRPLVTLVLGPRYRQKGGRINWRARFAIRAAPMPPMTVELPLTNAVGPEELAHHCRGGLRRGHRRMARKYAQTIIMPLSRVFGRRINRGS